MIFGSIQFISFELEYTVEEEYEVQNKTYRKYMITKKNNDNFKDKKYIAAYFQVDLTKQDIIKKFYYIKTLKIFNIINKENFYEQQDGYIIVYPYLHEFQLNQEKLKILNKEQKQSLLVQLGITMLEMLNRKVPFNLHNLDELFLIDGYVFVNLMEYRYLETQNDQTAVQHFKKFVSTYFNSQEIVEIQDFHKEANTLESYVESIIEAFKLNKPNPLQSKYFSVFQSIFKINQVQQLASFAANSHIYKFSKPLCLNKVISFPVTPDIIVKSTKIEGEQEEQIKLNVQREIELMEKFDNSHKFAACFKYLRIFDQSYLFMRYYCMNLREYFELIQEKPAQYFNPLIVYFISFQFIKGLTLLHRTGIKHLDLKPENLFITEENILQGELHIADFDRSERIQNNPFLVPTVTDGTPEYSPPEGQDAKDYTIDMWQFGLIIYEAANMGVYPGKKIVIDFEKIYGSNVIDQKLEQYNYDPQFLNIIKCCLSEKPNNRPQARDLEEPLHQIFQTELNKRAKGPKLFYSKSQRWQQGLFSSQQIQSKKYDDDEIDQNL